MRCAILRAFWAWLLRRPIRATLLTLFLLSLAIPVMPANPWCRTERGGREAIWGPLEPTYKLFYLRSLAAYGVEPWTVGDIVLRRWWQVWRQMLWRPYGEMHVSDAIINATRKPARSLMEGQWHGREVDGRIYEPTPAMQRLRSEQSIEVLKDNIGACSILRAVAIKPE